MSVKARYASIALLVTCMQLRQANLDAHHATATEYDISRTITVTGVISRLEWVNPHVHIELDAKIVQAADEHWDVELAAPGGIIVAGLSKDSLKPGSTVTITGYPGKNKGSVCATELKMANGMRATFTVGI